MHVTRLPSVHASSCADYLLQIAVAMATWEDAWEDATVLSAGVDSTPLGMKYVIIITSAKLKVHKILS